MIVTVKDHRLAMWELYWMVFYNQSRLDTFQRIKQLGFSRRDAAKMIQHTEREG